MSFQESIIIPYQMFKKCNFSTEDERPQNILEKDLPSDIKMKLYSQVTKKPSKKDTAPNSKPEQEYEDIDFIVQLIDEKNQPFARSIIEKMRAHEAEITWNKQLELILDGKVIVDSNIIELFKFILKNLIITRHSDVPRGAREFIKKLHDIGVPKSWIKASIARETTRRRRALRRGERRGNQLSSDEDTLVEGEEPPSKRKEQTGQGIPWITL
jgi:hypothetical protein